MRLQTINITVLNLIVLVIALTMTGTSYGQQQEKAIDITGQWSLNYDLTLADVSGKGRQSFQKVNGTIQGKIRNRFNGRRFDFGNNGGFTITNTNGGKLSGTWGFKNKNRLVMTDENGIAITYMAALEGSVLTLRPQGTAMKDVLFKRLFFDRVR